MRVTVVFTSVLTLGLLFGAAGASGQVNRDRDEREVLVASIQYLRDRIPAGSVINVRSAERFSDIVERPDDLIKSVAASTGFPAVDVQPLLTACLNPNSCALGVVAYINLTPVTYSENAEVIVSWIRGQSFQGLRSGYAIVLRLARRDDRWIVVEKVREEGFSMVPAPKKS